MFNEPFPEHKLSGEMPPSKEPLSPRYWEVLLEDSPTLTMYMWLHMTALQNLPGRVPHNESGFHFPNMWRQWKEKITTAYVEGWIICPSL